MASELGGELGLRPPQVEATLALSQGGATVPFIARYRKEATGGLDELQIQAILDRAEERRALGERRQTVLRSIEQQGKLTPELAQAIAAARTRAELEDLYLPYKPKRRTRATLARERGLEPLADLLWRQELPQGTDLGLVARPFVDADRGVANVEAALAGACDICAERVAEEAALRALARARAAAGGRLRAQVAREKREQRSKFEDYYDHEEPLSTAPSHRVLALLRGEAEEVLRVWLAFPEEEIVAALTQAVITCRDAGGAGELAAAVADGWKRLLGPSLESELRADLRERAEQTAIEVFAQNLRPLLLAAPAGMRRVLALDPGLRTGAKLAALDETGKLLATATLYAERSADERARAISELRALCGEHRPALLAIGNGTGCREAIAFAREALAGDAAQGGQWPTLVTVSEQGASVYSASETARQELPELDVSLRGAVSIGRRLQDPLAELVKIDPKSIGVGQYQHDVNQSWLKKKLGEVVDSCVNAVGADVNTASAQLLEHVSGLGPGLARRIVADRQEHGPFCRREALRRVSGIGPKTFEQAAGFLRVRVAGAHPLDGSGVHPERYPLVERMARDLGVEVGSLVGNPGLVRRIDWRRYLESSAKGDAQGGIDSSGGAPAIGEPTLRDILAELEKPGRDPRGDFSAPAFRDDLRQLSDLREGMVLEGVVTNVTAFGAFVDVGVHQDGLVHLSQLSTRFIKDPAEVARVGDRLRVKVLAVDLERKRLSLSARAVLEGGAARTGATAPDGGAAAVGGVAASRGGRAEQRQADRRRQGDPRRQGQAQGAPRGSAHGPQEGRPQAPSREPFNNPFLCLRPKR